VSRTSTAFMRVSAWNCGSSLPKPAGMPTPPASALAGPAPGISILGALIDSPLRSLICRLGPTEKGALGPRPLLLPGALPLRP
jgi:hypothetical protein